MDTQPTVLRYQNYEVLLYPPVKTGFGREFRPWWDPEAFPQDNDNQCFDGMAFTALIHPDWGIEGYSLNWINEACRANGIPEQEPLPPIPEEMLDPNYPPALG